MTSYKIHNFITGVVPHPNGLFIHEILEKDYDWFEAQHDVIQWLFPLFEMSQAQPNAPYLSRTEWELIYTSDKAGQMLVESVQYMLEMYEEKPDLVMCAHNHNHLRVTRMIKCINLFYTVQQALGILDCMVLRNVNSGSKISDTTLGYWCRALEVPRIPPDQVV